MSNESIVEILILGILLIIFLLGIFFTIKGIALLLEKKKGLKFLIIGILLLTIPFLAFNLFAIS